MKDWQQPFYTSQAWKNTREAYKKSVGGLCELCYSKGIVKAGEMVHHKIPLNPMNIQNVEVALDWSNLQCVCRECHAKLHERRQRRYKLDEMGRVVF